ncbi:MAG: glycosyl transferase family 2 [Verrucomicrobia bacterium]|nr:MAG: glycosyl transferase family 2 [Verrucomicrobiota bacterium]
MVSSTQRVAVVIPCYRVKNQIVSVVQAVLPWADHVIVVDDACPEQSGAYLAQQVQDPKLRIIQHKKNMGVGGAMIAGYQEALKTDALVIVKMDGDGQMDPKYLGRLIAPLLVASADFSKGNRFYDLLALPSMPWLRKLGNFGLTFLAKISSGYWHISDPTNGFIAIRREALSLLNIQLLDHSYFFEINVLVQLNIIHAVAVDVPIPAQYGDEKSSLNPLKILFAFPPKLLASFFRRIWWRYFVYDVNMVTIFLVMGVLLFFGGTGFGIFKWFSSVQADINQPMGTIALAMLPIILGFQLILQAAVLDIVDKPATALCRYLKQE